MYNDKITVIALLIVIWSGFSGCNPATRAHFIRSNGNLYLSNGFSDNFFTKKELVKAVSIITTNNKRNIRPNGITINHPYNNAVFPRDIASPNFSWDDSKPGSEIWLIHIGFPKKNFAIYILSNEAQWTPDRKVWEIFKENSIESKASVTILGVSLKNAFQVTSKQTINLSTSKDEVRAPILYQQMPLPILEGSKHPEKFQWLLGDISSYGKPRIILENQPVCGMCHHFSQDGKIFGMDMDIDGDKGAFGLSKVKEHIVLKKENFISWTDFQNNGEITLGLFAKISPGGNYVVSTIKEKRIFIAIDDPEFSELFFAFKGVLAYYSRVANKFYMLPGADDPDYVHIAPTWSPDGKYIVFSRAKVNKKLLDVMGDNKFLKADKGVRISDLNRKYQVRYSLYKIPFDSGGGGTPEPLLGASHNGKSNYWPRYSPDGKWIVFTQSDNAMMNQPGSQLIIIPANGGVARKMKCNRKINNSWHSWSPNGKWLVFSSKVNTPYTELFLTHIDEQGNDSPPVLLSRFNSKFIASVLPEFANIRSDAIKKITVEQSNR